MRGGVGAGGWGLRVLAGLLALAGRGWAWGCPGGCECREAGRTVRCVGRDLREVSAGLPGQVRELVVSGNRLGRLEAGALSAGPLPELRRLVLSDNGLAAVGAGALAGLPRLRQLDLSRNRLAAFSADAFGPPDANGSGAALEELGLAAALAPDAAAALLASLLRQPALAGLRRLDVSGNRLTALPAAAFSGLSGLQHLDLHDSGLGGLDVSGLARLRSLDLSGNALSGLGNGTVHQLRALPELRSLRLARNPWRCDCHLRALLAWLREPDPAANAALQAPDDLRCAAPPDLRGRPLASLTLSWVGAECPAAGPEEPAPLQTSYALLGLVLALIGAIFLLVLYLNRQGIKKWLYNIRDACRDHMEGYHYRYEVDADPRLANFASNADG